MSLYITIFSTVSSHVLGCVELLFQVPEHSCGWYAQVVAPAGCGEYLWNRRAVGLFADALRRLESPGCALAGHTHSDQQAVLCHDAGKQMSMLMCTAGAFQQKAKKMEKQK